MSAPSPLDLLRADIGADEFSLPADQAQAVLDLAAAQYGNPSSAYAAARVFALRQMLASAARLTDYKQNTSSETLSQVFKHLKELLEMWQEVLDAEEAAIGMGAVRSGRPIKYPASPVEPMWRITPWS